MGNWSSSARNSTPRCQDVEKRVHIHGAEGGECGHGIRGANQRGIGIGRARVLDEVVLTGVDQDLSHHDHGDAGAQDGDDQDVANP